jgi:8-oxo-dGTP pyrophosphatase MutT (NUDIX family)
MTAIPKGARAAARVLVLSEHRHVLPLKAQGSGQEWWLVPGGGLEDGETFEDGAKRELYEEIGMSLSIGPWVWTRLHQYTWRGQVFTQYERFFVAGADEGRLVPGLVRVYSPR